MAMPGNGAVLSPLRLTLLAACCLPLLVQAAGESWNRSRGRRSERPQFFQLGPRSYLGCMLFSGDQSNFSSEEIERGVPRLADRISTTRRRVTSSASRRPTSVRPTQRQPACPSGVTFFDGCNSCSCGTEQLCTLKACNADTTVQIFDPCGRVTCGYHQRCQPICVGQVCELKPLCVSDDSPDCHNCPWLCVDERLNCSDDFGSRGCKPTLACYKPNV